MKPVTTDSNLVNPWGLSRSSTSPRWVSDNGSGFEGEASRECRRV